MSRFIGKIGRNMSVLMSATIDLGSTVGKLAKNREPSSPFSSPRDGDEQDRPAELGPRFSLSIAATSSMAATPEALSIAPL